MEAPLNVKAAINLSDDFQRNGRPCFKLMPTLVGSDTAPDLDRPGLTNRSDEVHALHTAPTLLADAFCATCLAAIAGRSITMTAPSPCRSGKPSCLDDPVVTRVRSRGVFRCPIRFLGTLTGATPGGLAAIHRATLLAPPGMVCQPRSPSPTS